MDAFSAVTGIPVDTFIKEMGLDGSEYGIPTQMALDVLLKHGFAVTPIEKSPSKRNPLTKIGSKVFEMKVEVNRWKRHLSDSKGVLFGFDAGSEIPHAIAWNGLVDGAGDYDISEFKPYILWRVTQIAQSH